MSDNGKWINHRSYFKASYTGLISVLLKNPFFFMIYPVIINMMIIKTVTVVPVIMAVEFVPSGD